MFFLYKKYSILNLLRKFVWKRVLKYVLLLYRVEVF